VINSAKHAVPDTINIQLFKRLDSIELIINDDGKGFDVNALERNQTQPKGIGLKTLRDRADIYGGSFLLKSTIGKGTTLQFIWPILKGTANP
jgi:two-component system sensor histidine kinase NreB